MRHPEQGSQAAEPWGLERLDIRETSRGPGSLQSQPETLPLLPEHPTILFPTVDWNPSLHDSLSRTRLRRRLPRSSPGAR